MATMYSSTEELAARRERRRESRRNSTYKAFLKDLVAEGITDEAEAERACTTILGLLLQRLAGNEGAHLCAQLPGKLQEKLDGVVGLPGLRPKKWHQEEFLQQIAEELDVSYSEASDLARAVFRVIRRHVSEGEIEDVLAQLPHDLTALWEAPM